VQDLDPQAVEGGMPASIHLDDAPAGARLLALEAGTSPGRLLALAGPRSASIAAHTTKT
jgi:hypothetical protein